jgi:hypothetical protein
VLQAHCLHGGRGHVFQDGLNLHHRQTNR